MMSKELIEKIIHLPISERIEIIEKISRSVREDLRERALQENTPDERKAAYFRLRGIASITGKKPPNDEEVQENFRDYMSEKHK